MKYVETPTVKLNQNRVLSKSSLAAYGIQRNEARRGGAGGNLLHMRELTSINGTENYSLPWKLSSPDRLFRRVLMAVDWWSAKQGSQVIFTSALPSKVIWLDKADTGLQMTREICPLQNVSR